MPESCPVCGTEQTPTTYCVVVGTYHATFESEFVGSPEETQ